jgi:uncharacterized protein YjbJ (UPF0337 family)
MKMKSRSAWPGILTRSMKCRGQPLLRNGHFHAASVELRNQNDVARTLFSGRGGIAMDWNRIEGSWKQTTGKIKEKWGKLTDDDLTQINGKREQFEGKIQERYGIAKDQVRTDVDTWLNSLD